MQRPNAWFLKAYKVLIGASLALIALGGATRAMNAGLSCPDWPLCFWQVIPDAHYEVYYEFLHRVLAGIVGIMVILFQGYLLFRKQSSTVTKVVAGLSIFVLLAQITLGALTVLKLLNANVVTMHLAFGVALFALLIWNYWQVQPKEKKSKPKIGFPMTWLVLLPIAIFAQIILGGMVSTRYAGLACPDFPLCLGQWVPTWDGLVGLHVMHRFGAYFVFALVLLNFVWSKRVRQNIGTEKWMIIFTFVQILLGVSNVVFRIPPIVTVLHLVTGATILALALRQLHLKVSTNN